MKADRKEIEIMAPVGSYEALMAAIHSGAGSVYFGVGKLNMRSRSSKNFTIDDLRKIASICDENDVKSYLTVNTVIYDDELEEMRNIVTAAKESGISAVIASDQAVINFARSIDQEVHLSTQCNVSNKEAVRYYAQFADVIVLARELSVKQMKDICDFIEEENIIGPNGEKVKIEVFIHGALCMSISGKCYLSLHDKAYSANRGACIQNCRRSYTVKDKDTGEELDIDNEYIMSPKDLMTIDFLDIILNAGVKVLKIEGRGRSPEYVKRVVECYHDAVDAVYDGSFGEEKVKELKARLETVFNRGFWDGYYLGRKLGEWSDRYGNKATKRKVQIGKGKNYYSKLKVAVFDLLSDTLKVGDDIIITGPTTGVVETKVKEIHVNNQSVETIEKGVEFSIPLDTVIRGSDKLYKWVDTHKDLEQ